MINSCFILCILVFLQGIGFDLSRFGFTADRGWPFRVSYLFAHATMLHLSLNMLSFYLLFKMVKRSIPNTHLLLSGAIVVAILATFGSEMQYPTIGASGVVMFLYGCFVVFYPSRTVFINLAVLAAVNILTYFVGHTNGLLHLFAFIYGLLFAAAFRIKDHLNLLKNDYYGIPY